MIENGINEILIEGKGGEKKMESKKTSMNTMPTWWKWFQQKKAKPLLKGEGSEDNAGPWKQKEN